MAACALVIICAVPSSGWTQAIPVYPGATLVLEAEPGETPMCCDFIAKAPFEKVISFYEGALKTGGLDPKAFGARYPDLKHQADALIRDAPPGMKVRILVLAEQRFQGKTSAETFDVASTPAGVRFTIMKDQLRPSDARFAEEWEARMSGASRQAKAGTADWTKLRASFPKSPPSGFTVDAVQGDNGDANHAPYVQASYQKVVKKAGSGADEAQVTVSIDVMITDEAGNVESALETVRVQEGGERAVKVGGKYDGKEIIVRDGRDCTQSGTVFLVNRRYVVEVKTYGFCDLPTVDRIIDGMNLNALTKRFSGQWTY